MVFMDNQKNEPELLHKGKKFHKKIQKEWSETAQGKVKLEKGIIKPTGRKGRIDIFVKSDNGLVVVAEIKNSDWEKMTLSAVRKNIKRHARQIWSYIDTQLDEKKDVSPGIIFPRRPKNIELLRLIEVLFDKEGIPVVWDDETVEESKERSEI